MLNMRAWRKGNVSGFQPEVRGSSPRVRTIQEKILEKNQIVMLLLLIGVCGAIDPRTGWVVLVGAVLSYHFL